MINGRLELDDLIGNKGQLAILRKVDSGLVLITGKIGTGKTTVALAKAYELTGVWLDENQRDGRVFPIPDEPDGRGGYVERYLGTDMTVANLPRVGFFVPHLFYARFIQIVDEVQDTPRDVIKRFKIGNTTPRDHLFMLVTSEPQKLDKAIRDRCADTTIEMQELKMDEIEQLAARTCSAIDLPYEQRYVQRMITAGIRRPRSVIKILNWVKNGGDFEEAIRRAMSIDAV